MVIIAMVVVTIANSFLVAVTMLTSFMVEVTISKVTVISFMVEALLIPPMKVIINKNV